MFSSSPRPLTVLTIVALIVGCTAQGVEPTTTTTSSTTTTTSTTSTTSTTLPPTTTTTLPPFTVEGAPSELAAVVEGFYDYVAGRAVQVPPAPEQVVTAITPAAADTPIWGIASVGTFAGQGVATVEMGGDLFLAVY